MTRYEKQAFTQAEAARNAILKDNLIGLWFEALNEDIDDIVEVMQEAGYTNQEISDSIKDILDARQHAREAARWL